MWCFNTRDRIINYKPLFLTDGTQELIRFVTEFIEQLRFPFELQLWYNTIHYISKTDSASGVLIGYIEYQK